MTDRVVDTNVPIAANGRETHANVACQHACVVALRSLIADEVVVAIDDRGDILAEYGRHLRHAGRPGVGDAFFKHLHDYQWTARVHRVPISPNDDEERGFDELPPNNFDPSDRKFLAVAVAARALVLNATDSDWGEHADLMQNLGVEVHQLCPQHATKQAKRTNQDGRRQQR